MLASQKEDVLQQYSSFGLNNCFTPSPFSGWPSYPVTAELLTYLAEVILKSRDIQWNDYSQQKCKIIVGPANLGTPKSLKKT